MVRPTDDVPPNEVVVATRGMVAAGDVHPALVVATRHGLPTGATSAAPATPPARIDPSDNVPVLDAVRFDRLDGLLAASLGAGEIDADAAFVEAATAQLHHALSSCVALEALTVRTIALLDAAGLPYRVLKGPALAHLDFAEPSQRCFGDVDLLVPAARWEQSLAVLTAAGYRRATPPLRPAFERRFGKGATIVSPAGLEVDLHRTFAIGRFGIASRADELFDTSERFDLGGRSIDALSAPARLLHACYHEAIGGFRGLRAARDVAQLLLVTDADWRATVEMATRWQGAIVVATAITDTWELLQLDADHPARDWAIGQRPTADEAAALLAFREPQTFRRQALTGLATMRGIGDKATYLYCLGVPSRASRAARQRSLLSHLRRREKSS